METKNSNDPLVHTANIKKTFMELVTHLREDINRINDPAAKAMFETAAEVINSLNKTFEDYEKKNEPAWQK